MTSHQPHLTATTEVAVTARDVESAGRITTVAQWGVAVVVMAGSMAAGGVTFHYLHEAAALGVVTAFAVDLALAAWLLISRRLRAVGVSSRWGVALELTTAVMTLFLNVGAALFREGISPGLARALLAVAHGFLPVMLMLVTLAGGEAQSQLLRVRRAREASERDALAAVERAEHHARQHQREEENPQRAGQRERTTAAPVGGAKATREQRRQWVRDQRAAGRAPSGAEVDRRFGAPRTGAAVVAEVLMEEQNAAEKKPLHVVGGH